MKNKEQILKLFRFLHKVKERSVPASLRLHLFQYFPDKIEKSDLIFRNDETFRLDKNVHLTLPKFLKIEGDCDIPEHVAISSNTTITRNLYLIGNVEMTSLPSNLYVGNILDLSFSNIMKIEDNVIVKRCIFVDADKINYFQKTYPNYHFASY